MQKVLGLILILTGTTAVALAAPAVPEIDPSNCASALALFAGAVLVVRGRRRP